MPAEVLSYFLKYSDRRIRLGFQVALQCAPFLKRLKVSCVITLDSELYGELDALFCGMNISYHMLSESDGKCLVLFYRPEELEAHLRGPEISSLIREYGYCSRDLSKTLRRLTLRVRECMKNGMGFPHEIGAFLGYPVNDVRGFIQNEGKGCLMTGYWKVYENLAGAKMIFNKYDRAKDSAVNEFLTGKTIREIAV